MTSVTVHIYSTEYRGRTRVRAVVYGTPAGGRYASLAACEFVCYEGHQPADAEELVTLAVQALATAVYSS